MNILGIDPGFANVGYAVANYDIDIYPKEINLINTSPEHKKRKIYVEDDNIRRAKYIVKNIDLIIKEYDIKLITMEAYTTNKMNTKVSRQYYGTAISIATIAQMLNIPLFIVRPQEIKKCICNRKNVSKEDIIDELNKNYPKLVELAPKAKGKHEHCYDAFASIITCIEAYDIIQLMVK